MLNNDFTRSDSRRGHQCPFTSVVILQKDLTGIVHACPVSDVNIIGSRTYSVKGISKQLSSNVIVLRGEDSSTLVHLTNVSSPKRVNKVLCILLTLGGILLFTRHKRLISLANKLGELFITAVMKPVFTEKSGVTVNILGQDL